MLAQTLRSSTVSAWTSARAGKRMVVLPFPGRVGCRRARRGVVDRSGVIRLLGCDSVKAKWRLFGLCSRNMFGPVRGPWPDDTWCGWWGDEPPYHVPVFVLTHHARAPFVMKGGTEFRFVTEGIDAALAQAKEAAGEKDVRLGGGVSTIRQYLRARLIDELHLAISPVVLGQGEHLLGGLDLPALGYACTKHLAGGRAVAHVILQK